MLWQDCLQTLENILPDQEINTWLRTLHGTQHNQVLVLLAPNSFVQEYVQEHHLRLITDTLKSITQNPSMQVVLLIGSNDATLNQSVNTTPAEHIHPLNNHSANSVNPENNLSTHTDNRDARHHYPSQATDNASPPVYFRPDVESKAQKKLTNNLNQKLTFDTFVEGKSNQLAVASAKQVADHPGHSYNPLFIYGGVGLGKTHLMHAIGNQIVSQQADARIVYLTSEQFVNNMIFALRNNRIEEFKQNYRSVDALLIDDIQFFAGKNRSVEEFFHTFNALLEGQKQIILTSDRYPRDVEVEDRLRSRLNSGLTVKIEPPEFETRVAILTRKLEQNQLEMPKDVAFFIAKRFRSNVRDLEGALQRVVASLRLHQHSEITLDFVHSALRDQLASQDRTVTMENIIKTVAQHFNIKTSDLESKRRTRSIARPRQVAMLLCKELTNHSLPEIGAAFGGRDHTTVLHACRKIRELVIEDKSLEENYRILERTLTR